MKRLPRLLLLAITCCSTALAAEPITVNVWPSKPPGETKERFIGEMRAEG